MFHYIWWNCYWNKGQTVSLKLHQIVMRVWFVLYWHYFIKALSTGSRLNNTWKCTQTRIMNITSETWNNKSLLDLSPYRTTSKTHVSLNWKDKFGNCAQWSVERSLPLIRVENWKIYGGKLNWAQRVFHFSITIFIKTLFALISIS
jgi:hypothetical protein